MFVSSAYASSTKRPSPALSCNATEDKQTGDLYPGPKVSYQSPISDEQQNSREGSCLLHDLVEAKLPTAREGRKRPFSWALHGDRQGPSDACRKHEPGSTNWPAELLPDHKRAG